MSTMDKRLPLETIARGYRSHHPQRAEYIITNQDDMEKLEYTLLGREPKYPYECDFSQFTVIAVFSGESAMLRSNKILEAIEHDDTIEIRVAEGVAPGNKQWASQPYHIAYIPKTDKRIIFSCTNVGELPVSDIRKQGDSPKRS